MRLNENTPNNNKGFINDDFLLQSKSAKILFHEYAMDLPIIDYHSHLPPKDIAENKKFKNITELWLNGDHYKWRALRTLGVKEKFITGDASDKEKFLAWAKEVPLTVRNPLFHWTHLELKNTFGIEEYLNEESAEDIYNNCNKMLQQDAFSAQGLLKPYKVEFVGTTDDPCDNLFYHQQLKTQKLPLTVHPTFRPDKIFGISNRVNFMTYLKKVEEVSEIEITDTASLLKALENRINYFHENGCRVSDHGIAQMPITSKFSSDLEREFRIFLHDDSAVFSNPDAFKGYILAELCKMYHSKGWVQQFHLGPIRNNNSRLLKLLGADCGVDSIGDLPQANSLASFLNKLDGQDTLAKTIIYNINPADNEVFASMVGNFNDGSIKGKIQFGTGWWYLDQKDGMEKQINALSNIGIISTFIGMTTDSRSFLSYSRHEYFRRVLCNLFGDEMKKGLLPNDEKWIGSIVRDICYNNAKEYFIPALNYK